MNFLQTGNPKIRVMMIEMNPLKLDLVKTGRAGLPVNPHIL